MSRWCKTENPKIDTRIHTCSCYTKPQLSIPSPPTHDQPQAALKETFASAHVQLSHGFYRNTTALGLQRAAKFVSNLNLNLVPTTPVLDGKLFIRSMLHYTPVAQFALHQNTRAVEPNSSMYTARPHDSRRRRKVNFHVLQPLLRHKSPVTVDIELLNALSLTNKSSLIHDHILDKKIDIMCLTET